METGELATLALERDFLQFVVFRISKDKARNEKHQNDSKKLPQEDQAKPENSPRAFNFNVLNDAIVNAASDDDLGAMFRSKKSPRLPSKAHTSKLGKENSPVKRKVSSKVSKASTSKVLLQPKLSFARMPPVAAKKKNETIVKAFDDDETYCEELENSAAGSKSNLNKSITAKRKIPRRNSFERPAIPFSFQAASVIIPQPSSSKQPTKSLADPNLNIKTIKQEKLTESCHDLFADDDQSKGSSIIIVEPDENDKEPILIPDSTIPSCQSLIEKLKRDSPVRNQFFDAISPEIPGKPTRRRRLVYGDCDSCREV